MSRTVIAAVVAVVIAVLTFTAYYVTGSTQASRDRREAEASVARAAGTLGRTAALEALSIQKRAEALATSPGFLKAIKATTVTERSTQAQLAFQAFRASDKGDAAPDILAIVNDSGEIVAMDGVASVVAKEWKTADDKIQWPAISAALRDRNIISETWDYPRKGLMKVGVAPIVDPDAPVAAGAPAGSLTVVGAVVIAYAVTAQQALRQHGELGTEVAYFDSPTGAEATSPPQVFATSFRRGNDEDTTMQAKLARVMVDHKLAAGSGIQEVSIDGTAYLAAALRVPRYQSRDLPADYPAATTGALVLQPAASPDAARTARTFILLLGIGAIVVAGFGLYLSNRRILGQVDQIELGVADIINGNVDRTFRPVGRELDGLANGLNVMLARLLGRPEPGEEELDDDGNPIVQGRVEFDEDEAAAAPGPQTDPELAMLAQESEPDYYKRVYTEYLAARKAIGSPDEVSFENFIAKLKMNEGKLKAQHQCRAVRFRVVTKDGKVSLKPVPIFA
ncbi:MAG: MXAN_5187 C-terminal domain-containing protein [Kofleriaceae bacterium]